MALLLGKLVHIAAGTSIFASDSNRVEDNFQRAQLIKRCHYLFKDATLFGGGVEPISRADGDGIHVKPINE